MIINVYLIHIVLFIVISVSNSKQNRQGLLKISLFPLEIFADKAEDWNTGRYKQNRHPK